MLGNLFKDEDQIKKEESDAEVQRLIDEAYVINQSLVDGEFGRAKRMYDGNHWEEDIEGVDYDRFVGYSKLVNNFVGNTVDRWTNFIGSVPPTFVVTSFSETNVAADVNNLEADSTHELDDNEAEAVTKICWNMLRQNNYRTWFMQVAHIQSLYGRVTPYVHLKEGIDYPVFEIPDVFDFFPVFSATNFNEVVYAASRKAIDTEQLKKDYKLDDVTPDTIDLTVGERPKAYRWHVITDTEFITVINEKVVGKRRKHKYGQAPFFTAHNRFKPFSPCGKSDVSDIYLLNKGYNQSLSNLIDVTEDAAIGKRLVSRAGQATDMEALQDRKKRIVQVGVETEILDLPPMIMPSEIIGELNFIEQKIEDHTGITELLKGRFSGSIATGVALSGLSRGVEDLARGKIVLVSEMMEKMLNFSIKLLKEHRKKDPISGVPYSKIFKRDKYNFDFYWDNTGIQDERIKATTQIDLINAGISSKRTARKNLKIPYIEDEQSRVSYETMNPLINKELGMALAQEKAQGSVNPEVEEFNAKQENGKLLQGLEVKVTETDPQQHAIHMSEHEKIKKVARGKMKTMLEAHIAEHAAGAKAQPQQAQGAPVASGGPQAPQSVNPAAQAQAGQQRPAAQPGVPNPQQLG